jgi:hypothetical protein
MLRKYTLPLTWISGAGGASYTVYIRALEVFSMTGTEFAADFDKKGATDAWFKPGN